MLPSGDVNAETIFSFLLFCVVIICFIISLDGLWCLAEDPTPDCVQVCMREYGNDCLAGFGLLFIVK
jgi:hypothetical protein